MSVTNLEIIFADVGRLTGTNNQPKIWVLDLLRTPIIERGKRSDYIWTQYEINCVDNTLRTVFYTSYDESEEPVQTRNEAEAFAPIIPGSVGEHIGDLACKIVASPPQTIDASPPTLLRQLRDGGFDQFMAK